jgi:CheY-like chemotaxis protein
MERRRILVVEDDADAREMMVRLLDLSNYHVEAATNGRDALDRLRAGVLPDVILLDMMMPVMDGWTFLSEQRRDADLAAIPVIVLSAAGQDTLRSIEGAAVLTKPCDHDVLLAVIDAHCPTRLPADAAAAESLARLRQRRRTLAFEM